MEDLATSKYWSSKHEHLEKGKDTGPAHGFREWLKHATRDYANEYLLKEHLLKSTIPHGPIRALEVGCAPGGNLLYFNEAFGHDVYGVEYTSNGVEIVRDRFVRAGIPPEQVIEADFFNPVFQAENKGKYDFVFSEGFIEHFDDPKKVVQSHIDLLKPGGYLFILIPNLSGINRLLTRAFHSTALDVHNTSIMNLRSFTELFPEDQLAPLFCDYLGMFTFGLFAVDSQLRRAIYRFLQLVQRPINLLFRLLFRTHPIESPYASAYLVYVGRLR